MIKVSNNSVQYKYSFFPYTQLNVRTVLYQTIQFSISIQVQCQKTVLFQTIQFSISTQFSSVWPIDRTLSGATTLGQSGPRSDVNEGVLHIFQSSSMTRFSLSDCLVSYPGHLQRSSQCILQPWVLVDHSSGEWVMKSVEFKWIKVYTHYNL